jgi:NAD(P)-dependent dehydrogenase (short-subunit alcohol dehydrogenase family)
VHQSTPRWEIFRKHFPLGKRDGVNVNVIHPGATETERFYQLLEQRSKASGKSVEQLKQEATVRDGLRRLGKPSDISALVLFLCSENGRHIQAPQSR